MLFSLSPREDTCHRSARGVNAVSVGPGSYETHARSNAWIKKTFNTHVNSGTTKHRRGTSMSMAPRPAVLSHGLMKDGVELHAPCSSRRPTPGPGHFETTHDNPWVQKSFNSRVGLGNRTSPEHKGPRNAATHKKLKTGWFSPVQRQQHEQRHRKSSLRSTPPRRRSSSSRGSKKKSGNRGRRNNTASGSFLSSSSSSSHSGGGGGSPFWSEEVVMTPWGPVRRKMKQQQQHQQQHQQKGQSPDMELEFDCTFVPEQEEEEEEEEGRNERHGNLFPDDQDDDDDDDFDDDVMAPAFLP